MSQRWVAVAVVASTVVAAVTCVRDDLVECSNGVSCPVGLRCVEDEQLGSPTCADQDHFDACIVDDHVASTGTACTIEGHAGTCFGGACIVEVCGDRVLEGREACDDGNTVGSDGCSANCASTEACGDGAIDLAQGEQCDDGVRGVSGDGCSSKCKVEYLFWRDVTPAQLGSRFGFTYTTSPTGNVLLFGGTVGSGSNQNATYDETWEWDGTTWAKLAPPVSPPRRTQMAFAYDKRRDRVVMFGGFDANATLSDSTWEFDGITWTQKTPTVRPQARASASMACSPQTCVLVGGEQGSGSGDTWMWDGDVWTPLQGFVPPGRQDAVFGYDEARGLFVLSNGRSNGVATVDVWELRPTGWTNPDNDPLPPLVNAASAYEPVRGALYAVVSSSVFAYRDAGWASAETPSGSGASISTLAWNEKRQRLTGTTPTQLGTGYELDGGGSWSSATHTRPGGSTHAQVTYDPMNGRTVLFDRLSGTWSWDGNAWRLLSSNKAGTPSVSFTAIAYDAQCKDIILYGGMLPSSQLSSDTWSFDGTWHQLPIVGPSARIVHSMAYDPIRSAMIMLGGRSSLVGTTTALADMWQLSGPCTARIWSRIDVTPMPSARANAAMTFDSARGVVVLFGGQTTTSVLGDTWTWDGTAWTQHDVTPSPRARYDHAFAFDPKRREIVLVGGRSDQTTRNDDVWRWDGTAWSETPALVSPAPRAGAALAVDRTGALVLIGGDTSTSGSTPDVARLTYDQALHPKERCQLADADDDRDGLVGCDDPDCRWRCAPECPLADPFASCTGPRCGDGICSNLEDRGLCPADCVD